MKPTAYYNARAHRFGYLARAMHPDTRMSRVGQVAASLSTYLGWRLADALWYRPATQPQPAPERRGA